MITMIIIFLIMSGVGIFGLFIQFRKEKEIKLKEAAEKKKEEDLNKAWETPGGKILRKISEIPLDKFKNTNLYNMIYKCQIKGKAVYIQFGRSSHFTILNQTFYLDKVLHSYLENIYSQITNRKLAIVTERSNVLRKKALEAIGIK